MRDSRARAVDGEHVGPYRLERWLGRGGMAEVFAASHVGAAGFERRVCIKRIIPSLAGDAEFRALFVREARVAGALCHSNLVQVFDCVEDGETLAIVMELVDGLDLRHLLRGLRERGEKLPAGLVAFISGQVLNGLSYAHEQQVIHRDVSPHNILLSRHGEVKLADFGVAKAMLSAATRTGELKGKLAYMSPEQAMAKPVDHRTDLYSVGLVLHELITGERFFKAESQAELIAQVVHAQQPKLTGLEPQLAALIERLLAPDAGQRFQTADEAMAMLPPWEVVGPSGFLELRRLVRSLVPAPGAAGEAFPWAPTPSSGIRQVAAAAVTAVEAPGAGTAVLPGAALEGRLERPVVPAAANAPTATRENDVRQAIASLPTDLYDKVIVADGATAELTATGLKAPSRASATAVTELRPGAPRRKLVIAAFVASMLAVLVAGTLLGAAIYSREVEPHVRGVAPPPGAPRPPAPETPPPAALVPTPPAVPARAPLEAPGPLAPRADADLPAAATPDVDSGAAVPRPPRAASEPDAGASRRKAPRTTPAHSAPRSQDPFAVPAIGR